MVKKRGSLNLTLKPTFFTLSSFYGSVHPLFFAMLTFHCNKF